MLDLTYYQSIFNENNTEIRCRKVLEEVSPSVKPIFHRFIEKMGLTVGNEYQVSNYDVTLSTTYHDARNPNYAEKKKHSDIGRKYFIQLHHKMDDKEYNSLTLEFDGINKIIHIYSELKFVTFWAWVKSDQMNRVLDAIPDNYVINSGAMEKPQIAKNELIQFVKNCIKPRKRPRFQVGKSLPLDGQINEDDLLKEIMEVWENLRSFLEYYREEIAVSTRAFDALMLLAGTRNIKETQLFGREYTVELSTLEAYKTSGKSQAFQILDGDQMVTKGYIYYLEYHDKNSPFQTIIVQLEGHNHIFTSSRQILGTGSKEWWIPKVFATHNLDNQSVMNDAMRLLKENNFKVNGTTYCVGTFNNDTQSFVEGVEMVKKNFINSALLFAHASKRLKLPSDELTPESGEELGTESDEIDTLQPNFHFPEIYSMVSNSQFSFSKGIIRDLHLNLTALDDKHFVLLSGISGTGKTQLCRLYANAVYGLEYESENPYFTIIPVRPDWTDASALFGYYSSFEKRYVKTEFLNVILNALKEREKPHFILLDEMNLARVEYYLSDYLSAVESRKEIPLHQDDHITDIPKKLLIPPNVYILGTINVDETTHSISDKVLDRAFVMTLSDVDFDTFWDRIDQDLKATLSTEFLFLKELHQTLSLYDLHFGYRTMGEMLQKLFLNQQLPEEFQMDPLEALDRVISEKVLTKVRGDARILEMLEEIKKWLERNLKTTISLQHVKRMKEELGYYGATQFWR